MTVEAIAYTLAASRYRFLSDEQIGVLRRKYGATRDEIRTAAIIADRIRRLRQIEEGRNNFSVPGLVEVGAPVILPDETKAIHRWGG